ILRTFDAAGQMTTISDVFATYSLTHDGLGRVTRIDNAGTAGMTPVALSYAYDAAGNVVAASASVNGQADWTTSYSYDSLNRLATVSQAGGEAVSKSVGFQYDAAGEFQTVIRSSGAS